MKLVSAKNSATICALLLLTASQPLPAQTSAASTPPKIGVVDLKKLFEEYWKTKQADAKLKDTASDLDKKRKDMVDAYQKSGEDYKKLLDSTNDQAVSAAERDKRKKSAETKLIELRELEQTLQQFDRSARTRLAEEQRRMRDNLLVEIRSVINSKAKAANYTLVIDTASETVNNTPVVLYTGGQDDLTSEVLSQLNAGAPPITTPAPPEKKDAGKK